MTTSDNISAIEAVEKAMEGVTPCGYQRRPRYEHRSSTVSGTPWALCGWEEATDMFRREPRFEYRPIYDRETILAEARKAEALIAQQDRTTDKYLAALKRAEAAETRIAELEAFLSKLCDYNDTDYVPNALFARARTLLNGGSDAQG